MREAGQTAAQSAGADLLYQLSVGAANQQRVAVGGGLHLGRLEQRLGVRCCSAVGHAVISRSILGCAL